MTDTPLVLEDSQSQEPYEINFRECRKRLKLNAYETDFESATGDQLDNRRLQEYQREVLSVFIAGSTLGAKPRLYEKYGQLAELMATYIRVIPEEGEPIEMAGWDFLRQPEWALNQQRAQEQKTVAALVAAGECTAETLFVSQAMAQEAVAFTAKLAAEGFNRENWRKLGRELGVEILPEEEGKPMVLPQMDQLAYRFVADQTLAASIKSREANKQANLSIIAASMATIEGKAQRAALQSAGQ